MPGEGEAAGSLRRVRDGDARGERERRDRLAARPSHRSAPPAWTRHPDPHVSESDKTLFILIGFAQVSLKVGVAHAWELQVVQNGGLRMRQPPLRALGQLLRLNSSLITTELCEEIFAVLQSFTRS